MLNNWTAHIKSLSRPLRDLRAGTSDVMKAFTGISQAALKAKALDTKTKELVAVAICVSIRCDDCIAFHVKAALEAGATREEIMETLGTAIYMGAGPSVMYAAHAVDAMNEFAEAQTGATAAP